MKALIIKSGILSFLAMAFCIIAACMPNQPTEDNTPDSTDKGQTDNWEEIFDKYHLNGKECVVISKEKMSMQVIDGNGRAVRTYRIACGKGIGNKQKPNDMKTPEGKFRIERVQNSAAWVHDFKDGKEPVQGAYGPFFVRLYTPPFTGIGIHGTHDPASIGTRVTEGCVRLLNPDLEEFVTKYAKVGMPVIILEDNTEEKK